jgi:hypothetical protein
MTGAGQTGPGPTIWNNRHGRRVAKKKAKDTLTDIRRKARKIGKKFFEKQQDDPKG